MVAVAHRGRNGERYMVFPTYRGKPCGYVNTEDEAKSWLLGRGQKALPKRSPFLEGLRMQRMLDKVHTRYGLAYSWGGWTEDRSTVRRGSHLDEEMNYIHFGVDFNVPAGTPVEVDRPCKVVLCDSDHPLEGGWGARVMVYLLDERRVLIYAHLQNVKCEEGDKLAVGEVFAEVAKPCKRGISYPHLHVQAMTLDAYAEFKRRPCELDRYGKAAHASVWAKKYPDPMQYLRL